VLGFACVVLTVCVAALSWLPLLRARGISVATVLKSAGRSATGNARTQRTRSVLVVAQVAMAMVLVSASGLMARSFLRLRDVSPGFDGEQVLSMRFTLPPTVYSTVESRLRFQSRLLERLREVPGARASAITSWIPMSGEQTTGAMMIEGMPIDPNAVPPVHARVYLSDSAFRVMGTPIIEGRTFLPMDRAPTSDEVIVSQSFAKRYWPGQSAIGKRVRQGTNGDWQPIVGVVGDVHLTNLQTPPEEAIYLPLNARFFEGRAGISSAPSALAVLVRADGDPSLLVRAVRDAIHAVDPALPTYEERPLADVARGATARMRFTFFLLGAASLVTLLLGAVGIYGVLAYGVSLRRREFGVRMALGASPADVRGIVARQGVRLATIGVGVGLVVALGTMRLLGGLLYDVSPNDPMTLGATCVVLVTVAFVASWLPARRASLVAPTAAIRGE
jgi:putative ABC transport system permease protein